MWQYFGRKMIEGKEVGKVAVSCTLAQLVGIPSAWESTEEGVDEIVVLDATLLYIPSLPVA